MKTILLTIQITVLIPSMFLIVFCSWEFLKRYNLPYNEIGRYFDEEGSVVYFEDTIPFFGFLSMFFVILSVTLVVWILKTIKKYKRSMN